MTDHTADAAKLLQAQEAARLCSVSDPMFAVHLQTMRDFILNTRPQHAPPAGEPFSEAQIKHMVDRFLGWQLPKPWAPDNGISYLRPNYMHPPADHDWPTGTNLFDWSQAEAMVRHMIKGMPGLAARPKAEDAEWLTTTTLYAQWRDVTAKLAEREADLRTKETQLAQAEEWVSESQSCFAELRDVGKSNSRIDWLYGETSKYLNERHQSRQQAAKEG